MTQQDEQKLRAGRGTFNFKGCLVTQIVGGWQVFSTNYSNPEQVIDAINRAGTILSESIVYPVTIKNNGNFNTTITDENLSK